MAGYHEHRRIIHDQVSASQEELCSIDIGPILFKEDCIKYMEYIEYIESHKIIVTHKCV
jgi:hypothetical protein